MSEFENNYSAENQVFLDWIETSKEGTDTSKVVDCKICAVNQSEIKVSVEGRKHTGIIPDGEYSADPDVVPTAANIGDEIKCIIMKTNDEEGVIYVSKRLFDARNMWEELKALADEKALVSVKIEGIANKNGGLIGTYKGAHTFIPVSNVFVRRPNADKIGEELEKFVGKAVDATLLEVQEDRLHRNKKSLVASIKYAEVAENRAKREEFLAGLEKGKHYDGTIVRMNEFSCFLDLGAGFTGRLRKEELAWHRISKLTDVVAIGDHLDVYVKDFGEVEKDGRKTMQIELGFKNPEDDPWANFTKNFEVGTVCDVTIEKIMPYGAFATIIPNISGLIHISQLANRRVENVADIVSVGDIVSAKITAIDGSSRHHKIKLSIRALFEEEAPAAEEPVYEEEAAPAAPAVFSLEELAAKAAEETETAEDAE